MAKLTVFDPERIKLEEETIQRLIDCHSKWPSFYADLSKNIAETLERRDREHCARLVEYMTDELLQLGDDPYALLLSASKATGDAGEVAK